MIQFDDKQTATARVMAYNDLYFFSRWMFLQRRGYKWQRAAHHKMICDALMKVFSGETKRLIINIPPRYSKTELAVVNFIAWAMGRVPDCEFIHASYSATLAVNNSVQIRNMVQHEEYQAIFPDVSLSEEAKGHWKTTAGGVMYATGTGGTITGFGAGKHRPGFGGCFPAGTKVWTERGLLAIDDIVHNRMSIKVWAYDYQGNIELRPITAWHRNPDNAIVRVTFDDGKTVECTPCHRFWTLNRGWVRADSLSVNDKLPCVIGSVVESFSPFITGNRQPSFIDYVRHDNATYCLTVEKHHNFIVNDGFVVKNCLILDDLHKADEARSNTMRQNVVDWFQNTLESRKNSPETPIVVIMQRLHEEDIAGWLLNGGNGEKWEHLCLSAITDDGQALWPEKHDIDTLRTMERAAPYVFAGQYMQRPAPLDGGMFKPDKIEMIEAIPAGNIKWVRGWDLGATIGGDPTAGVKLGLLDDGRYVIADLAHGDLSPDERDLLLKNAAVSDGKAVKISIPQDPGQAGKTQVLHFTRMLAGYSINTSPESGDKVTRAEPFAAQVNVGNVMMLKGHWNKTILDEMRLFPNGKHDDCIDACSRAFGELIAKGRSWFG